MSSDWIAIWYIRRLCTFRWAFSFRCPFYNLVSIRWVAAKNSRLWPHLNCHFTETQHILIGSTNREGEVTECVELHNLRIYYVTIQSELNYLIGEDNVPLLGPMNNEARLHLKPGQNPFGFCSSRDLNPEIIYSSGSVLLQNWTVASVLVPIWTAAG